jgi:hypothetical protein
MRIFIWPVTFVGETGRPFGGSEGSAHAAKADALRLRRDFEGHAKWLRLQYEMALRRRRRRPHQPRARWNSDGTNFGLPFQKRDVITRLRRRSGTRVTPADYGRDLATGVEKRPTDRFQKARYRLVTLVNHPKPAGKRADADGLPIGWKIGQ